MCPAGKGFGSLSFWHGGFPPAQPSAHLQRSRERWSLQTYVSGVHLSQCTEHTVHDMRVQSYTAHIKEDFRCRTPVSHSVHFITQSAQYAEIADREGEASTSTPAACSTLHIRLLQPRVAQCSMFSVRTNGCAPCFQQQIALLMSGELLGVLRRARLEETGELLPERRRFLGRRSRLVLRLWL